MSKAAYNPANIEGKWYQEWMKKNLFKSVPDKREPYTIVIPPPNVTGVLHMGHMLNNTIQDVLIRRARMLGYNACWVPGTDHASIATEAKVVNLLREQGIKKSDIGREKFLEHAFAWKEKYGGIILDQLKRLGASCDWDRTRFTMEPKLSEAVIKSFVHLYNKGYIYRDWKIVNWDPAAQTTLSNEEVIRKEVNSKLYYVKYQIKGSKEFITIATTRPETIMGDTAVCIHSDDERYKHLHGKTVIVPIVNREVPVICDDYIDMTFGTGMLKVTPAHDANDYEIGVRFSLPVIDVLNADGTISEAAEYFIGDDRFVARKKAAKWLEENGLLAKVEEISNSVGYSERNPDTVVEPRLSLQWFVKMEALTKPALDNVMNDTIRFFPENYKNVYKHWLENIRDWPISRQLWWGQQIPAWFFGNGDYVVAENAEEALDLAKKKSGNAHLSISDLKQDEDVVDTWFSSWLWPISVFDGFDQNSKDFEYYYPTNVLVTGWDIIFFWVARMIFAGYEFKNEKPFHDVYFTGMVRDLQRRKMSKSLGNSPDALGLIDKYGADGVRFGMLSCAAAGNDLLFDEKLCEQGRNFSNKLWNAHNLLSGWEIKEGENKENEAAILWFESKLNKTIVSLEESFKTYRLSEALMNLYNFIWNDFCSSYLEFIKPDYQQPIDRNTYNKTVEFFDTLMQLLHPFMPFITEELWQSIAERESICLAAYPKAASFDEQAILKGEYAKEIITAVREIRNKNSIKNKDVLDAFVLKGGDDIYSDFSAKILKLGNLSTLTEIETEVANSASFIVKGRQFFVSIGNNIDVDAKKAELEKELEYTKGFVASIEKKLSNERFVQNAPEKVIEMERQKLADGKAKINLLQESIGNLK
jgi:valyl-tRNA synthetase